MGLESEHQERPTTIDLDQGLRGRLARHRARPNSFIHHRPYNTRAEAQPDMRPKPDATLMWVGVPQTAQS